MRIIVPVLILLSGFLWYGCDMINPVEKLPTYVRIDSFHFTPTPNTGTTSQKITSMWVYFEGQALGVFNIPATIPVLSDQKGVLLVTPGVTYSGLNDVQSPYPYFLSDTVTIVPNQGQVINFTPRTRYLDDSLMNILHADFETSTPFAKVDGDTGLVVVSDPNLVFEGNKAGYIYIDNKSYSENIMFSGFNDPKGEAFLEMNYKCSVPFEVGLQTTDQSGQFFTKYMFGFKPRADWNKVYIGFRDFITANPNKHYRVVIKVGSKTAEPFTGFVSLDNLKVITKK